MAKELYELGDRPPLGEVPEKMYAFLIREERFGEPKTAFKQEVVDVPEIAPDEVLVYVMAAGINYNNVWAALGIPIDVNLKGLVCVVRWVIRVIGREVYGDSLYWRIYLCTNIYVGVPEIFVNSPCSGKPPKSAGSGGVTVGLANRAEVVSQPCDRHDFHGRRFR